MAPKTSTFFDLKTCLRKSYRHSRPPPHTMCPTAFLAPTLTAKTCFICTQPQNAFFLAQLALQGNRANGKKSLPGRVPGPKKGTKMVPNSGSFQEEFFLLSGQKKSESLNMVRRKRFIKWQTLSRNAKSSFEGTNPTPPSPMQQWRPPARTTIVSRTVGHHLTQCAPPPS